MGTPMVIVLPLPSRELSPNARPHYMAKARAVKRYRETAYLLALAERPARPMHAAKVTARFFFSTRRRRDRDNLLASLKPAFDSIADARVVTNDAGMIHMPVEQYVDRTDPRVEIVVEAVV
ncbi:MAG: RusA family crossover junction endodeoxyribonuclease [Planctomycetes bacterium]|nr:RusA family crossover junction endodeoxyribonuclease [Planctomycetota bacterium]